MKRKRRMTPEEFIERASGGEDLSALSREFTDSLSDEEKARLESGNFESRPILPFKVRRKKKK